MCMSVSMFVSVIMNICACANARVCVRVFEAVQQTKYVLRTIRLYVLWIGGWIWQYASGNFLICTLFINQPKVWMVAHARCACTFVSVGRCPDLVLPLAYTTFGTVKNWMQKKPHLIHKGQRSSHKRKILREKNWPVFLIIIWKIFRWRF